MLKFFDLLIEDYKIQNFLTAYPDAFRPLDSIVDPDKFMDYKLSVMTKDNHRYGAPFDSGVAALFYRTDYLKEAGPGFDREKVIQRCVELKRDVVIVSQNDV